MASANLPQRGTLLKRARLTAGLTQEELAARSGVSIHTFSDLERDLARRGCRPVAQCMPSRQRERKHGTPAGVAWHTQCA